MKLNSVFKHRSIWLGFAMVVIMFYHSQLFTGSVLYALVKKYGFLGVDIFIFASGIGCYYSLEKDPDILRFLLRRLRKLAPTYFCFTIVWLIWRTSVSPMPMPAIIGSFLGLESFASWDYHFNWYISALLLLYFLVPYLKRITDSFQTGVGDLLMVIFLVIAAIPFWEPADRNMIIYSRLPIFYLGVVSAKLAKRGVILNWLHYLLLLVGSLMGYVILRFCLNNLSDLLWFRGLYWYPLVLIVPGACLLISFAGEFFQRNPFLRWVYWILERMGIYSFELYLVHSFLYAYLMKDIIPLFSGVPNNLLWLATIPVVLIGCFLLNRSAAMVSFLLAKVTNHLSKIL